MNMLNRHRLPLLALAAGIASAVTGTLLAQAGAAAVEQAVREMNIMRNIFGAAVEEGSDRRRWRISEPDALYLAGQGMVFSFDMPGGGFYFGNVQIPQPPMPPMPTFGRGGDFDYDFDYDFDFDTDIDIDDDSGIDAAELEQIESYQRQLNELEDDIEDRQQALRERERTLRERQRELERLARQGEQDGQGAESLATVEDEVARLGSELQSLDAELRTRIGSYTQLAQEFQTERNAAAQARRDEQTADIFATLCDYGLTLKSLAAAEHVNLVFRHYADDQDQVYVIDRAALAACGSGEELRQGAVSYLVPN